MGVKGLTGFVKDNRSSLCHTIRLDPAIRAKGEKVKVVVDAWGILFPLYLSSLPWQSGGEYLRFYRLTCRLIETWRTAGLEPTFVFDGASPPEKHNTLIDRLQKQITTSRLFYTTSPESRSLPSFSKDATLLPPLTCQTFILALTNLDVNTQFVPMGEADGAVVATAEKLGAYILSQDSDYLILLSGKGVTGVKGYCPLDMLSWIEGDYISSQNGENQNGSSSSKGGWQTTRSTREYNSRQSHLIPPSNLANPVLVLTVVSPLALRQRLRLPASVMPLFAALCGNDYTSSTASEYLFDPGLKWSARIDKVARTLREVVFSPSSSNNGSNGSGVGTPSGGGGGSGDAGQAALELVKKVVKKLSIREFAYEGELMELVENIIEASFAYSIPLDGECCDLYPFCGELDSEGCQTSITRSRAGSQIDLDSDSRNEGVRSGKSIEESIKAYAMAQRRGHIGSVTHAWLFPDRVYLWNVLEDPSTSALKAGEGHVALRRTAWSIADEGLGGLRYPPLEDAEEEVGEAGSESPVKDVSLDEGVQRPDKEDDRELRKILGIEEDTDPATGDTSSDGDGECTTLVEESLPERKVSMSTKPPRSIIEYIRKSNRILPYRQDLPPLSLSNTSTQIRSLAPIQDRLKIYLQAMQSDLPAIPLLSPALQPLVAIIRFCVIEASRRASVKSTDTQKWRRGEVEAVMKAALGTWAMWEKDLGQGSSGITKSLEADHLYPLLSTRNASIVAQIAAVMTDSTYLAQALLILPDPIPLSEESSSSSSSSSTSSKPSKPPKSNIRPTHLIPFVFFSGVTLHTLLNGGNIPKTCTTWRWESREQRDYEICMEALSSGGDMDEYVVGWSTKPRVDSPSGSGEGVDGGKGLKQSPRQRKKQGNGGGVYKPPQKVGRYDLLEGLS